MPLHSRLTMDSPLGPLAIGATARGVESVSFCDAPDLEGPGIEHAKAAVTQLREYFAGDRSCFDLPLDPSGTPFQRTVWDALTRIPFGETISYASLAQRIGNPKAVRAVGAANGRNPIAIVVPCHRVIGSGGELRGYGGEVWRKEELLRREGAGLFS